MARLHQSCYVVGVGSSLVLRDLTLRSASSFGAFHLIRLMFDEYVAYTVEHKVAAATGVSSVAAFGDMKQVCFVAKYF